MVPRLSRRWYQYWLKIGKRDQKLREIRDKGNFNSCTVKSLSHHYGIRMACNLNRCLKDLEDVREPI
ncbi:hypothetical protein F0562_022952 [Nyssa sinensis]|uniref:Uncharacterized protein n=1 Tax=Nyssa sinensis TaxID=561372 RepID=A0A5J5BHN9_9ASTE|nr:hypothetical protein F0562_022952 [Nyssa sinensis]